MAPVSLNTVARHVRLITHDNPAHRSSMSSALAGELYAALDEVGVDNDCRVVILTGNLDVASSASRQKRPPVYTE